MSASIYIDKKTVVSTACPEFTMKEIEKFTGEDLHYGRGYFDERHIKSFRKMFEKHKNEKDLCGWNPFKQMLKELKKRGSMYMRCEY